MSQAVASATVKINADPATVYAFVTNPYKAHLVLPGLLENFHIPELPVKPGDYFHYTFKILGMEVKGITRVTELEADSAYAGVTEGGVNTEWRFEVQADGHSTRLQYTVMCEMPSSLVGKVKQVVVARMNQKLADQYVKNLKRIIEYEQREHSA